MIDEEWLKTIRGKTAVDAEIQGLLGVGTEKVVFKAVTSEGKEIALQTPRTTLSYHIQELSRELDPGGSYSIPILNQKLARLVGKSVIQRWTFWYNKAHVRFLRIIQKAGIPGCLMSSMSVESTEYIPFFLGSPGMTERLRDLAEWPEPDSSDPSSFTISIPECFSTGYLRDHVWSAKKWSSEALESISNLGTSWAPYATDRMYFNPLIIWGAAILSDFFVEEELEEVASFIENEFGRLATRDDAFEIQGQFFCMASLFAEQFEGNIVGKLQLWLLLAKHCGIRGEIADRAGNVVASSLR